MGGESTVSIDLPGPRGSLLRSWYGRRLAIWPRDGYAGTLTAILSSRQRGGFSASWLAAFRTAVTATALGNSRLITTAGTTTDPLLERAAHHGELPLVRYQLPSPAMKLADWLRTDGRIGGPKCGAAIQISPRLDAQPQLPAWRDGVLLLMADRIFVCGVRRRGNLERLLRRRLMVEGQMPAEVLLADDPSLIPSELREELCRLGAKTWSCPTAPRATDSRAQRRGISSAPIRDYVDHEPGSFLLHCTRAPRHCWPNESEEEYLDDLLSGRSSEPRTALGALCRMLRMRRISATAGAIRGQTPVVSFTSVALSELASLRVFRPHRHRWDFEPYGIGVRRSWLQDCGARPVAYGDEATWQSLSADERPFFQVQSTRSRLRPIDWRVEAEWRQLGDVDLSRLTARDAYVFVPSLTEAQTVADISPFPVVVVPYQAKFEARNPKPETNPKSE